MTASAWVTGARVPAAKIPSMRACVSCRRRAPNDLARWGMSTPASPIRRSLAGAAPRPSLVWTASPPYSVLPAAINLLSACSCLLSACSCCSQPAARGRGIGLSACSSEPQSPRMRAGQRSAIRERGPELRHEPALCVAKALESRRWPAAPADRPRAPFFCWSSSAVCCSFLCPSRSENRFLAWLDSCQTLRCCVG